MFYLSNKEKSYWYTAKRVKKGTTSKGEPYTFIGICSKDKQDGDKYKDATVTVWDDVDINEGDSIAIHSITGVNYKETESGFKKYISLQITANNVKTKPAEENDKKKSSAPKQEQAKQKPKAAPSNDELYGGNDEDLPF